jgi:hypothetical protein
MSPECLVPVRLYWADGRVEELKERLDVMAQPQIVRRTDGRHVHFAFTGVIDAHGFAVYEELAGGECCSGTGA